MGTEADRKLLIRYFKTIQRTIGPGCYEFNEAEAGLVVDMILSEPRQVIRMLNSKIDELSARIDRLEDMHKNVGKE